jgi:hypothetical protein
MIIVKSVGMAMSGQHVPHDFKQFDTRCCSAEKRRAKEMPNEKTLPTKELANPNRTIQEL